MIGGHATSSEPSVTMGGTSFAKLFQRRTFGAEHGAQDRADGDAQHRLERFELAAFGPGRDLAHHLFFDDAVVAAHPLAVKRRAPAVCGARGVRRRQG